MPRCAPAAERRRLPPLAMAAAGSQVLVRSLFGGMSGDAAGRPHSRRPVCWFKRNARFCCAAVCINRQMVLATRASSAIRVLENIWQQRRRISVVALCCHCRACARRQRILTAHPFLFRPACGMRCLGVYDSPAYASPILCYIHAALCGRAISFSDLLLRAAAISLSSPGFCWISVAALVVAAGRLRRCSIVPAPAFSLFNPVVGDHGGAAAEGDRWWCSSYAFIVAAAKKRN